MDFHDTMSLDSTGYVKGAEQANKANQSIERTIKELSSANVQLAKSYGDIGKTFSQLTSEMAKPPKQLEAMRAGLRAYLSEMQSVTRGAQTMGNAITQSLEASKKSALRRVTLGGAPTGMSIMPAGSQIATGNLLGLQTASVEMRRLARETELAEKQAARLEFTWRTAVRIFESFVIYRGIYAIGNVLTTATQNAAEFQAEISQIRTISQDSQLSFETWSTAVKDLSNQFGFPLADVAKATYEAVSNQIGQGTEAIQFMSEAQKLAITTSSNLADTTNALAGIMNAYGYSIKDTYRLSAKLFSMIDFGRIKMADLGNQIGDVSAVGALLGVNFNELAASISEITIRSITPAHSLTQVRNILMQLLKPSKDMKVAFKELGVESATAGIQTYGLIGFLKRLSDTKGDLEGLAEIFRNIRGFAGAAILTSETGFRKLQETTDAITNSTEKYAEAIKISTESSGKQLQMDMQRIKNYFTTELGVGILETTSKIIAGLGGFDAAIKVLVGTIELSLIPVIARLLVSLRNTFSEGGTAAIMLSKLGKHPVALAIMALAALLVGAKTFLDAIEAADEATRKRLMDRWNEDAQKKIAAYKELITEVATHVIANGQLISQQAAKTVSALNADQKKTIADSKSMANTIKDIFQTVEDGIKNSLTQANSELTKSRTEIEKIKRGLQDLKEETRNREIAAAIDDKKPSEQVAILKTAIQKLTKEGLAATTFDDMKYRFEEAKKLTDQMVKITDKSEKDKKKIEKEINAENRTYLSDERRLRKEIERARQGRRSALGTPAEIKNQLRLATEEHNRKIDELRQKENTLAGIPVTNKEAQSAAARVAKMQEEAYRKYGSKTFQREKDLTDTVEDYKRTEQEITRIQRQSDDKKFNDIIKIEDTQQMEEEYYTYARLQEDRVRAMAHARKMTVKEAIESDQQIRMLDERLRDEQIAIFEEVQKREIFAQQKTLVERAKIVEAKYQILADAAGTYQEELLRLMGEREKGEIAVRTRLAREQLGFGNDLTAAYEEYLRTGKTPRGYAGFDAIRNSEYKKAGVQRPEFYDKAIESSRKQFEEANNAAKEMFAKIPESLKKSLDAQNAAASAAISFKQTVTDANDAVDFFAFALDGLSLKISRLNATYGLDLQPQASGGPVSKGKDSILAMLSPGEYVMNAKSTRKFYSQLVAMNSGIPAFANGGMVSNNFSGDFNISLQSSGNETVDVQRIGHMLRREIRRGTVKI